jgi:CheY-like chemotaxis protein
LSAQSDSPIYVLVVEDEFLSRLHAVNLVEDAGYKAVEASNAEEAIAILEARKDIRIVFTDVDMPGTNRWPQTRSCHPHTLASNRAYCHLRAF